MNFGDVLYESKERVAVAGSDCVRSAADYRKCLMCPNLENDHLQRQFSEPLLFRA